MSKYTLLTGATGLVGRYLVRDLLLAGQRLAVAIRAGRKESVQDRMEGILQQWESELGRVLPRPVVLEGDVCEPGLGLESADRSWIAGHCNRVIHNAAILEFHGPDRQGEPWRTNLHGTRHMLELCRELKLRDLHYVSTAYVCGRREGVVSEEELDVGQQFRNDYEESKFLAEQEVRRASFLDHLTVYRPAVIAGDSETGYTSTYHGLYVYMRLIALLVGNTEPDERGVRNIALRLNFTGDEGRNIVPVDWVSAIICRLSGSPAARGGTYHLAPQNPITSREIVRFGKTYWNTNDVEFWGHRPIDAAAMNDLERAFYANSNIYESYETTDPRFDTTNLSRLAPDLPCPIIDEPMMHRFLKYGEADRWGKRRCPRPHVEFCVRSHLRGLLADQEARGDRGPGPHALVGPHLALASRIYQSQPAANSKPGTSGHVPAGPGPRRTVGLDVLGPGGGQWTLHLAGAEAIAVEQGLPVKGQPVLTLPVAEFSALAGGLSQASGPRRLRFDSPADGFNGELAESSTRVLFPHQKAATSAA